jgi:hypothetical protein
MWELSSAFNSGIWALVMPAMSAAMRELGTPSILRAVLEHRGLKGDEEPCNLSKVRKQRNADWLLGSDTVLEDAGGMLLYIQQINRPSSVSVNFCWSLERRLSLNAQK